MNTLITPSAAVENNKDKSIFTKNHIINWYSLDVDCVTSKRSFTRRAFITRLFAMADSCGEAEQKAIETLRKREHSTRSVVTSISRLNVLATFTRTSEEDDEVTLDNWVLYGANRRFTITLVNWILYEVKRGGESPAFIFINEYDENRARKHVEAFLKDFCKDYTIVDAYGIDYVAR